MADWIVVAACLALAWLVTYTNVARGVINWILNRMGR